MDGRCSSKLAGHNVIRSAAFAGLAFLGASFLGSAYAQDDPMKPIAIPVQTPAKEAVAEIPDTRLWYWDTGGTGVPIVLLHPATGSALIWGYQQPVFAKAGYRVIAYSRRGYINSAPFDRSKPGNGSEDLRSSCRSSRLGTFPSGGVRRRRQHRVRLRVLVPGPAAEPHCFQQLASACATAMIAKAADIHPAEGMGRDAGGIPRARPVLSRRQSGRRQGLGRARAQGARSGVNSARRLRTGSRRRG